jgi:hypothetical protein
VVMHALVDMGTPRLGTVIMRSRAELELGEHWISKELVGVRLSKKARGLYGEGMMSNLYELDQPWSVDILDIVSGEAI